MKYSATKQHVANRGVPSDDFLDQLVEWGKQAPDDLFAPNSVSDIYSSVYNTLGPWQGIQHRRCVMLEVLRVLAGYESSWNWNEGAQPGSNTPQTAEAGAWQVSADSLHWGQDLIDLVEAALKSLDPIDFQNGMKKNHTLAMSYIAHLLRRTTQANGPVLRHEIDPWLRNDAVQEFSNLIYGTGGALKTAVVPTPATSVSAGNFYTNVIQKDPRFNSTSVIDDINLLEPVTRAAVLGIISDAKANGLELMVFETYRSEARQQLLFKQKATKLQTVGVHHYGLACDIVKSINGVPSWKGDFSFLGKLAKKNKLVWGGDWGEPNQPHSFQDDDHVQRITIARQHDLFNGTWYPSADYNPYSELPA